MKDREKRIILMLTIFTIIFTMLGGTFAYFRWTTSSEQNTNVTFTVTSSLSCSGEGVQYISSNETELEPTECTNSENVIKREIFLSTNSKINESVYYNLWLDIDNIGQGLSDSENLKYTISTMDSCTSGIIQQGNFKDVTNGDSVYLLNNYRFSSIDTKTFYLYIWLDAAEESPTTMNQSFELQFRGSCTNAGIINDATPPVLDDGLIPIKYLDVNGEGMVTTSSDDPEWYDYENQKWANAILVKENGTKTREEYRVPGTIITEGNDILGIFVWIPRYSYVIPELKCSEITGVNPTEYPNCYVPVLSNESDKYALIQIWQNMYSQLFSTTRTSEQLAQDIDFGLENGYIEGDLGIASILLLIDYYYPQYVGGTISYTLEYKPNNMAPSSVDINFESKDIPKSYGNAQGINYRTHPAFTFGNQELDGIWVGKSETSGEANAPTVFSVYGNDYLTNQTVSEQFNTALLFSQDDNYGLSDSVDSHMMKNSEWGAVLYLANSIYGVNNIDSELTMSSTGNMTGVFDMYGGVSDRMMSVYDGVLGESGFTTLPDRKYYDLYTGYDLSKACDGKVCYGHALSETKFWYTDPMLYPNPMVSWMDRGGIGSNSSLEQGLFLVGRTTGVASDGVGFRVVLAK